MNLSGFVGSVDADEAKDVIEGDLDSPIGVSGADRVFLAINNSTISRNIMILRWLYCYTDCLQNLE